eukprot:1344820-Pleurochrysis_carterae.AAC.1
MCGCAQVPEAGDVDDLDDGAAQSRLAMSMVTTRWQSLPHSIAELKIHPRRDLTRVHAQLRSRAIMCDH